MRFVVLQKTTCFLFFGLIALLFSSCFSNKNITYFPNLHDTTFTVANVDFTPKIQKGDILLIIVNSPDPQSAAFFSSANSVTIPGATVATGATATPGFLVERDGTIVLPKIGSVIAAGKTKAVLSQDLQNLLVPYLKSPVVNIRFMNYRVTVLGEVGHPGSFTTNNERMTILEALGQSGDIGSFGNRTNILVLRDSANQTIAHRINISNNSVFFSPYYYLQSNDVVYVEPMKQKGYSSSQAVILIPIISAALSTLLLLYTIFK